MSPVVPDASNVAVEEVLNVAVLGAAGGIGQSMCLLLKTQLANLIPSDGDPSKFHIHVSLYDVNSDAVNGVTTDLSHIDTPVTLSNHSPADPDGLKHCLTDAKIVIIPAGLPRKPGMTREDLFVKNAAIISSLADSIAEHCDLARVFVLIISNPVNSLVPVMGRRLAKVAPTSGIERRVLGVTKLDIVRASTFLHQLEIRSNITARSNYMFEIPVIGGHSGKTILPVFSRSPSFGKFTDEQLDALVERVQFGGDEVVKAKNGLGSATLSMALAAYKVVAKFVALQIGARESIHGIYYISLWNHVTDEPICDGAKELMELNGGLSYFSIPVYLNLDGFYQIEYELLQNLSDYEKKTYLPACLAQLKTNIDTGLSFK